MGISCFIERRGVRPGVTLLELLVAVGVVGVLMGIALPALLGVRRTALETGCITRVAATLRAHESWSAARRERWLTVHTPAGKGSGNEEFVLTHTATFPGGLSPMSSWLFMLQDEVSDSKAIGESVSCPVVFAEMMRTWPYEEPPQPQRAPTRSYFYAPGLFTIPDFWDESNPGLPTLRADHDLALAAVQRSAVAHPSHKVAMFEHHDNHGSGGGPIRADSMFRVTLGFADGHVERRPPAEASAGVPGTNWPLTSVNHLGFPDGEAIPFASTRFGYLGRDY